MRVVAGSVASSDSAPQTAAVGCGPGLLVFTGSLQLVFINREAWELSSRLTQCSNGLVAQGVLPAEVTELSERSCRLLRERGDGKDCAQLQLVRVSRPSSESVLFRAVGIPHADGLQRSLILIFMEAIGRQEGGIAKQVKWKFGLSDRQAAVVEHLLEGLTNKEIANRLGIAEQTVKDHMKRVMEKTRTTTRTGALMQLFARSRGAS
jgi:DNA-binding CsgD family transcriptional regulator